ncbi:uncharacterized protein LOC119454312 [Dermacentor silvarum]|uniref:uncharacterized protein LOC119454312 n=1 Tax=Dermacentor silvarum TaxID=543639 RepID=UPI002101709A|nr:uncharacterized protein LOC119454312 [Dermacentor silvarum]
MRVMGTPDSDAARVVIDTLRLPLSVDEYLAELDRLYAVSLPNAQLMPGVERLVQHLQGHGIPIALTTSSKPLSFGIKMTHHGKFLALFHHVFISGGDPEVKRGKPHPDIFLIAASKFEEDPAPGKVLVFEDTPAGVTAALEAGMQVVMVPDPHMDQENRSRATLCIDSLLDFKPELFGLPPFEEVPKRNTEKLYTGAAESVASKYGKKFTWELKRRVMGTPDADAARTIVEVLGLPLPPDEYMAAVDHIYEETFPNAQLMPGADRLVRHLHAHGVPMAIATSSKPASFGLKMMRHRDFLALFHHVVCSGGDPEVKRGKPHPDIFLVAASRFDKKPTSEKVLVFEDSVMGVTAALAAGMQVVMVPDPRMDEESKRRATTCINTLMDFKPEIFGLPPFGAGPSAGPSHSGIKRAQTRRKVPVPSFKPVSHVIFDLDGLLLDTEKLYMGAAETVVSQYGKKLTWELKRRVLSTPDADVARRIVEYLGLPLTPEGFVEAMERIYQEVLPSAELMPGADRIVRHLHVHGIPMAVATFSKRASFDLKMTRHQDLLALFHHVVCSSEDPEVNRSKPHPDIFLIAASRFDEKILSEKVLVFENSPMGVTAARAAGMQVVMVSDTRVDEENRRQATMCITSLLEFKPELFGLPSFQTSPPKS